MSFIFGEIGKVLELAGSSWESKVTIKAIEDFFAGLGL